MRAGSSWKLERAKNSQQPTILPTHNDLLEQSVRNAWTLVIGASIQSVLIIVDTGLDGVNVTIVGVTTVLSSAFMLSLLVASKDSAPPLDARLLGLGGTRLHRGHSSHNE